MAEQRGEGREPRGSRPFIDCVSRAASSSLCTGKLRCPGSPGIDTPRARRIKLDHDLSDPTSDAVVFARARGCDDGPLTVPISAAQERGFLFSRAEPDRSCHVHILREVRPNSRQDPQVQAAKLSAGPFAGRDAHLRAPEHRVREGRGRLADLHDGERYLDFASGVAVNALGHAHPKLIAALTEQADKLWHCSNLYRVAGQERLAERLCEVTFADKVFFSNSGAEACEGAIKLARRYHFANGHPERWRIVTFKGAFHGRTLATIAAAGNEKYLEGFGEPRRGFDLVPFGDLEAAEKAIGPHTAAIMVEPVQGEGGVRVGSNRVPRRPARARATSTACCSSSTRCSAAWGAPASCSPTNGRASAPMRTSTSGSPA